MAGELRRHHGGHGVHRSLLDSALRHTGTAWRDPVSGKRPEYEECAGAPDGLAGMSVAAVFAFCRVAESCLPAGRRCERSTVPDAAPHRSGADRSSAYWPGHSPMPTLSWTRPTMRLRFWSTYAKIADADESANPPRDQRNHGCDWFSDCRRHH